MGLVLLTERHQSKISGVLSCYDRILTKGTLPEFGDAGGMAAYLTQRRIRIFDFMEFVKPLTEAIKSHAKQIAADNGLEIQYISSKKNFRQEREVAKVLEQRGSHPGLVRIFSAIEPCTTYQPRFNKETHRAYLKPTTANVCTIISISSMRNWACAICASLPGAPSACSSTATATIGWPANWTAERSATRSSTMRFSTSTIGLPPRKLPTLGTPRGSIASWIITPGCTVRF